MLWTPASQSDSIGSMPVRRFLFVSHDGLIGRAWKVTKEGHDLRCFIGNEAVGPTTRQARGQAYSRVRNVVTLLRKASRQRVVRAKVEVLLSQTITDFASRRRLLRVAFISTWHAVEKPIVGSRRCRA